jgi:hypothetical protein
VQISAANTPLSHSLQQTALKAGAPAARAASNDRNNPDLNTKEQNKPHELTEEERRQVSKLQQRDREVRAHEAAHLAASGGLARGGASFTFQTGPDGRSYAVGGEVSIDTSPVAGDPQATIQKAQTIRAAALAPAQPSGADMGVAAAAGKLEASARAELAAQKTEERQAEIEHSAKIESEEGTEKAAQENAKEEIEAPANASQPTNTGLQKTATEASHYQDTINQQAPSEQIGQLLNLTA